MTLVNVVCCHVDVSLRSRSRFQRIPTYCGVSVCDLEIFIIRRPSPNRATVPREKNINFSFRNPGPGNPDPQVVGSILGDL